MGFGVSCDSYMKDVLSLVVPDRLISICLDEDLGKLSTTESASHHQWSIARCVLLVERRWAGFNDIFQKLVCFWAWVS